MSELLRSIVQTIPKPLPSRLTVDGQQVAHLVVTISGTPWRRKGWAHPIIRDEDAFHLFLAVGGGGEARIRAEE